MKTPNIDKLQKQLEEVERTIEHAESSYIKACEACEEAKQTLEFFERKARDLELKIYGKTPP